MRLAFGLRSAREAIMEWGLEMRRLISSRPAATMMVAGLADARMKFEIEVTARRAV